MIAVTNVLRAALLDFELFNSVELADSEAEVLKAM
jgi:hypothetical protein